ncbi:DUF1917-domain-containing protein [Parathielavia hyrcaniae]|uniref:DUF1917-domain-containing protein n=1 Tax=Parathielavia hyrcaniae TaxID=113614 RepID=A0AAN6T036_9PEZI|nr:DUF1917-domain-containing protein [Parathielavia hyrcaniae]
MKFLNKHLPPAEADFNTPPHLLPPWYWIANPKRSAYANGRADPGDFESFSREGHALLHEFKATIEGCARNDPIRTQLREVLKGEIGALTSKWGVTVGKWMLFPKVGEVNEVWRRVCDGVETNRLGTAAKVSTSCQVHGDPTRLICVYTKDFTDVVDVKRVLDALVAMGLVTANMPRGITYKCDAYTYLDIYGKNEYGLQASMYGIKEMLTQG